MSTNPSPVEYTAAEAAGVWCMRLSEGPLHGEDQAAFDRWLDADERHRAAFEEAVTTWREFDGAESEPEFLSLRLEALQTLRRSTRLPRMRLSPRWAAAAAVVVIAIGGAGVWLGSLPTIYETGVGERHVVMLKDGSKVSLDADTRVEVKYSDNRRALRLDRGRAKFDVAKDPLRPFSVAAADKTVVATGTEFSVELLRQDVHVILYEGHVAVLGPMSIAHVAQPLHLASNGAVPADQLLTPGHELVAPQATAAATVALTDPARTLAWEGGQQVFVDEPLASAVERIDRYSDRKVSIGDPAAGRILITGVFMDGDTRAFIEGVTAVFPVRAESQNGQTVLTSAPREN